ncbi:DUF2993 domain-containing protein [Dactylosporangium siamense]|uniref:DUF2993 domain-containing protein n=1 Tax=Dactylosporangium siamense TaxID=685454 RepID=A0A919PUJ3_9ACTN|nr:DUF2993 domain-containing protein [Dactylosporangium siamense]GIG50479.1 hypothetical protein Dsi01nite_085200 [Dactylosporangium siamense]
MAASRGAKIGIVLVVLAVILVGVLFVADRIAASTAQDRITEETRKQLAANSVTYEGDPSVKIAGFPFLTQVIAGEYEKITIALTKPQIEKVNLETLTVDAKAVKADARDLINGKGDVVAGEVTGQATMTWDNVRKLLEFSNLPQGVDPSAVDVKVVNNKIELRIPFQYQGFKVLIIANGSMVVESGKVRLKLESVTTDQGDLPKIVNDLVQANKSRLQVTVKLPGLPYNLVINSAETTDSGLRVIASAKDVPLSGQ